MQILLFIKSFVNATNNDQCKSAAIELPAATVLRFSLIDQLYNDVTIRWHRQRRNDTKTRDRHKRIDSSSCSTIILNTQLSTRLREPVNQIINASSSLKPFIITMQLTTLTAMLFAAVAIASPIALPAKEAAANIEVSIIP